MTVQENGWMDEKLMIRWIKDIYLKYTKKERSLPVLDSFHGHLTDSVKKACRKGNTLLPKCNHWTSVSTNRSRQSYDSRGVPTCVLRPELHERKASVSKLR